MTKQDKSSKIMERITQTNHTNTHKHTNVAQQQSKFRTHKYTNVTNGAHKPYEIKQTNAQTNFFQTVRSSSNFWTSKESTPPFDSTRHEQSWDELKAVWVERGERTGWGAPQTEFYRIKPANKHTNMTDKGNETMLW